MRTSRLATLAVTVMALAACTPDRADRPARATGRPARPDGVLVAITGSGDVAIDASVGRAARGRPGAVASPDGDALTARRRRGVTAVTSIDPRSGTRRER